MAPGAPKLASEEEKKEEEKPLSSDPVEREAQMAAVEAKMKEEVERKLKEVEEAEKKILNEQKNDRHKKFMENAARKEVTKQFD